MSDHTSSHTRRGELSCLGARGPNQFDTGEVPEWLKGLAWKASIRVTVSGVRIPLSPPIYIFHLISVSYRSTVLLICSNFLYQIFSLYPSPYPGGRLHNSLPVYVPAQICERFIGLLYVASFGFHQINLVS